MIKTQTIKCKTFSGSAVIEQRVKRAMIQKNLADKCSWSVTVLRQYEEPELFIIVPKGCKTIEEANFEILQSALSNNK